MSHLSLISLKNITKTFDYGETKVHALNGVSLNIQSGEFVAIMGPSGSGKSTLLQILGFLDRQTSGSYLFEGKAMDDFSDNELAHIRNKKFGFVFQSFNLLSRTTVLENVKLPLLYSEVKEIFWDELAKKAIDKVELSHRLQHEPSRLSGGEQQRAAIARALVNDPQVIFADEPTGNLDSKSGKIIMETLQKLNSIGKTIILITHETYTAQHAKRIIRLLDGEMEIDEIVNNRKKAAEQFIK